MLHFWKYLSVSSTFISDSYFWLDTEFSVENHFLSESKPLFHFLLASHIAFEKSNAFVYDLLILSGSFHNILILPSVLKFHDDFFLSFFF